HRMVVVELELPISADFRGDVQVGERAERPLLRRAAVVVVRTEVELVRGVVELPRIAGGIVDCVEGGGKGGTADRSRQTPLAGKGGPGTAAGKGIPRVERARAEIAARLQDRVLLLVV